MKSDHPDQSSLVDEEYLIKDLMDMDQLRQLFEQFTQATGFTIGFLDHPGMNLLIETGWRDICSKYHRKCALGAANCEKSNRRLLDQLDEPGKLVIEACDNGLVDCAIPIIISGKHIASLATGQLLLHEPDLERFKHQARLFGFDEEEYLRALAEIPVVDEKKLKAVTTFLGDMGNFISQMGYQRLLVQKNAEQMAIEIAERKRVEEVLREREARLRLHTENSPLGIIEWNTDFTVTRWAGEAENIFGWSAAETVGKPIMDLQLIYEEDIPIVEQTMSKLSHGEFHHVVSTNRNITKDGRIIQCEWYNSALFDSQGKMVSVMSNILDITERKRTEQALQENLRLLADAERIGLTGSWKRHLVTNKVIWSPGTLKIFGLPEDEEISFETFRSLIHPEDKDSLLGKLEETIQKGTPLEAEFRIIRPDGTISSLAAKGETTFDSRGKPILINGTVQDITHFKKLEDDLIKAQRLDSIGTLAGGIAHDYNNLLTAIMGNVDLAMMLITNNDKAYSLLKKAEQATLKARDLTQQLRTFSKGGYPISKIIDIRDCLIQSVKLALSGSNIRAEWNIAEDLPNVKVDENQIRLVIQNIVINAREAMLQGGTLFINATRVVLKPDDTFPLPEGIYIRLTFRDEGAGIPAEILPKVFDPYFTTKGMGEIKGMGLGLSICYSIIKRHKGHIMLDSKEGVGTTVMIHIPLATAIINM